MGPCTHGRPMASFLCLCPHTALIIEVILQGDKGAQSDHSGEERGSLVHTRRRERERKKEKMKESMG